MGRFAGGGEGFRPKHAERSPVRQKIIPRRAWGTGAERNKGGKEVLDAKKVVPLEEGSCVKSFLFRNFPPSSLEKDLLATFQKAGRVVDLFCPRKRDVLGKRFGFVRMNLEREEEEELMLEKMNSLWMGSYKLRVFIPRFERRLAQKEFRKPQHVSAVHVEVGRSFLDVVNGTAPICKNKISTIQKATFIPTEEEKEWLDDAQVGLLKKEFPWDDFCRDIKKEGEPHVHVKFMGEELVLILNANNDSASKGELQDWERFWFRWTRPWKPEDVSLRRPVWTIWYGVPLHAWSERFFKQLSLHFGSFMEWDLRSKEKIRLDFARVRIWALTSKQINDSFIVNIEGKEFKIRVLEDLSVEGEEEDEDFESTSEFSEAIPGEAVWAGDESESDSPSDGVGERSSKAMIGSEGLEKAIEGGGTRTETESRENGRVGSNFEKDKIAAGQDRVGPSGDLGVQEEFDRKKDQVGPEESLEFPPGWGPTDIKNIQSEKPEFSCSTNQAQPEAKMTLQAQISSEFSSQFPPGWGPTPKPISPLSGQGIDETQKSAIEERANREGDGVYEEWHSNYTNHILKTICEKEPECIKRISQKKSPQPNSKKSTGKGNKKAKKISERLQLKYFLRDMHSPGAEFSRGSVHKRKSPRLRNRDRKKGAQHEAAEVVKIGETLGLNLTAPIEEVKSRIEAKKIKNAGGMDLSRREGEEAQL